MTGITHESRLDRLIRLREQLDTEIAAERVIEKARTRRATELQNAAEVRRRQERRDAVPASVVRQWASTYGHPFPERGRVPDDLIDLYLDAHPEALRRRR
ncbi:Lsr2 family DNA-binding protein [Nocardioides sp. PD653]|uniref:Lsr2 family DNA-binding protein n=1 Tax=Nocardioides sp. PD653 TaxID=393303 RepID=UPI0009F0731F|nr:histone-like nucleoid-structuring protein Lsr2 [Nocardioides sp. PD653]GAW54708.1 Protein lsr2 [Nocardioides sp. PD653]